MKYIFTFLMALCATVAFGQTTSYPIYDGTFDGTTHKQTFEFPTGAQNWAGFANNNKSMYPLDFPNGGKITFKASASAATNVKFKFEKDVYPDVSPSFETANQAITTTETEYTIAIASQGANTFKSALFYIIDRDIEVYLSEIKIEKYDTDGSTVIATNYPVYDGTFDGTTHKQAFEFPTGAQNWAGFANNNKSMYPLEFPNGGEIKFKASASATTNVKFKFEKDIYPDVTPSFETANQAITTTETEYTIAIASQGANTFKSALFYIIDRDVEVYLSEVSITTNAPLSIDDVSRSFSAYPNPFSSHIEVRAAQAVDQVQVFDISGKKVLHAAPNKAHFRLHTAHLNKGVYMMSLESAGQSSTAKLIK